MIFSKDPYASARADLRKAFIGCTLTMQRRESDWWLSTNDKSAGISISTLWRLRDQAQILVTEEDDGHKFGLPEHIDAEAKANQIFEGRAIKDVQVDGATGDLILQLSDRIELEIIVASAGYECWQAYDTRGDNSELLAFGCSGGGGLRS